MRLLSHNSNFFLAIASLHHAILIFFLSELSQTHKSDFLCLYITFKVFKVKVSLFVT